MSEIDLLPIEPDDRPKKRDKRDILPYTNTVLSVIAISLSIFTLVQESALNRPQLDIGDISASLSGTTIIFEIPVTSSGKLAASLKAGTLTLSPEIDVTPSCLVNISRVATAIFKLDLLPTHSTPLTAYLHGVNEKCASGLKVLAIVNIEYVGGTLPHKYTQTAFKHISLQVSPPEVSQVEGDHVQTRLSVRLPVNVRTQPAREYGPVHGERAWS